MTDSPITLRASRKKAGLFLQRIEPVDYPLRCLFSGAHAVGNADSVVSIAGESEAREFGDLCFDLLNTRLMPNMILRHGVRMAPDAREDGLSDDAQQAREFVTNMFIHCCVVVLK